jgi:hypothetical protein
MVDPAGVDQRAEIVQRAVFGAVALPNAVVRA